MFIELHKANSSAITINLDKIEFFVSIDDEKHTAISVSGYSGWLRIEESYEQVKELIANATRR